MGRKFPNENNTTSLDPFLCFSFSIIGLATSIAIITSLCSVRFKRKSSSPTTLLDSDSYQVTKALNASTPPSVTLEPTTLMNNTTETQENNGIKELRLPPVLQHPTDVGPKIVKRATSERRLSFNLSMKMPRSKSVARNWDHKERNVGKKMKVKTDESVWMKTIILGGKCVPDEEEDAVIYEGKGKKISAYHPRQPTLMSLSRQWSNIDPDALSIPQSQEERVK